ncbi:MAG: Xylella phage Bacata [Candidatus Parcubacteria bacterium]|jgi:predicted NAD-dependent protein-ADP-ribosyltransferase YbiA (DUF1768 family)/adenine/guanine phosphoribosyltransferase-like PRPP-binding protein
MPNVDKEVVSFFEENTLADGSVDVSSFNFSSQFFKKEGESAGGKLLTTRGYDYICSLDSALTSVQKIKKYQETVHRVIESFSDSTLSKLEKLLLLDYLKNSLITILNAFVYQEKVGLQNIDTTKEYEITRTKLVSCVESTIGRSVDLVLNSDLNDIKTIDYAHTSSVVDEVVTKLIGYHEEYKLPSFYVSRPEATHSLTIIGSSLLCANRYKNIDVVVGVPSGGTEFAITTKVFIDKMSNSNTKLVLLPVSLHSLKQFSGEESGGNLTQSNAVKFSEGGINSLLICDDNTSTGRTLQFLKDLIHDLNPEVQVFCAVAEADTTRSEIDKYSVKRTHVANKDIYKDAVNILLVSKAIDPKVDLKEIVEKKKIIRYYKDMEGKSLNTIDQIYARVMAHVNESGVDYSLFTEENAVLSFHATFLSNFYATPVVLEGRTYPSVEHAYQSAKFYNVDWSRVSEEVRQEIRESLKLRGYAEDIVYSNDLFTDTRMTAGNIKIIADVLRKYDYVDKNWEDKRIKIMIDILLQKFNTKDMLNKLEETGEKELIEGNTWNDTLWGVCDGKGRNILGVILMEIRKIAKDNKHF